MGVEFERDHGIIGGVVGAGEDEGSAFLASSCGQASDRERCGDDTVAPG